MIRTLEDPTVQAGVIVALLRGASIKDASEAVGVNRRTVNRHRQTDPTFAALVEAARADADETYTAEQIRAWVAGRAPELAATFSRPSQQAVAEVVLGIHGDLMLDPSAFYAKCGAILTDDCEPTPLRAAAMRVLADKHSDDARLERMQVAVGGDVRRARRGTTQRDWDRIRRNFLGELPEGEPAT